MGYTHYFEGKVNLDAATLANVEIIIAKAREQGITVAGGNGHGQPEVTPDSICLNGDAKEDLDHETFLVGHTDGFGFCKTARKPYDAVVGAILLLLASTSPELVVTSDGDATSPQDWGSATTLFSAALDLPAPVELVNA